MGAAGAANVVGSILGGIGASKRAKAIKKAIKYNVRDIRNFSKEQIKKSDELGTTKQTYLEEGDPFADMGRFIFGDPSASTYSNIRKSQADFARLAAGDTSGFQKEVSSIVSNSLATTFGGPRGSFENLSAKNLLNFRQLGANTAMSLTDYFGRAGQQLIGNKFGILDNTFERQLRLREFETNSIANQRLQRAQQSGVGWMAAGNVAQAAASALSGFGTLKSNEDALKTQNAYNDRYLTMLEKSSGVVGPRVTPSSSYSGGYNTFAEPLPIYNTYNPVSAPSGNLYSAFLGMGGGAPRSYGQPYRSMVGDYYAMGDAPSLLPDKSNADPNSPAGRGFLNAAFMPP